MLGFKNPAVMLRTLTKNPMKIVEALEGLGVEGRAELAKTGLLGEAMQQVDEAKGDKHEAGDIEEQMLYSSWQYWGQYEYTSANVGTL